jgi:hypothetical protein
MWEPGLLRPIPAMKQLVFLRRASTSSPNGGSPHVGVTGGLQGRYNYQIGSFVPGLETDFNYLSNCRSATFAAPPAYAAFFRAVARLTTVRCARALGCIYDRFGELPGEICLFLRPRPERGPASVRRHFALAAHAIQDSEHGIFAQPRAGNIVRKGEFALPTLPPISFATARALSKAASAALDNGTM